MTRQRDDDGLGLTSARPAAEVLADTRKVDSLQDYGIRNWDDARLILALGRFGNFQGAAQFLDTDQTTVSRRYRRLEETLGAKLFERQGNRLSRTPAGKVVIQRALAMEALTNEINCTLGAIDVRPRGTVKIAVTEGVGNLWVTPRIVEFCSLHSDIDVELVPSHGEYDLLLKQVDIAIGYSPPDKLRLVGRRVAKLSFAIFAAQSYLAHSPAVDDAAYLSGHDMLVYEANLGVPSAAAWMNSVRAANRIRFRTSSAAMGLAALRGGVGVGLAPLFYEDIYDETELVKLPCSIPMSTNVWLVSHEETNGSKRVRLLIDFLTAAFERDISEWFKRPSVQKGLPLDRAKPRNLATRRQR